MTSDATDTAAAVADESSLRQLYRPVNPLVLRKDVGRVDDGAAAFLAATTLLVVASTGPGGADASPRGGPPGFVRVLDEHRIAFGDLAGNNRLDTYTNLTTHPALGLLAIVPGTEETLRCNGRAEVTTDPDVLEATAIDGRVPKVAVVVHVEECYIHCGKALRRAGVWEPSSWPADSTRPSPAAILTDHLELEVAPELVAADLEEGYRATLWERGGS
jgi:uncharacterized protein